jgi:peptide/nickel transport system permease protein
LISPGSTTTPVGIPVSSSTGRAARPTALQRFRKSPAGMLGATMVGVFVIMAVFAPLVAPHDPLEAFTDFPLATPSGRFLLGTDEVGRDLLSRLIFGARPALFVGVAAVALGGSVGILLGLFAGYVGGIVDAITGRVWDAVFGIPIIVLAVAVVAAIGRSQNSVAVAVAIGMIPSFARLARASTLKERTLEYVEACRALGTSNTRIILTHILPNTIGPLIVQIAFAMSVAVILEASLSFLGLGVQPPIPSWGGMMFGGLPFLSEAPLYGLMPGVFLTVFAISLNLLGEGLRKALSVREDIQQ